MSGPNPNMHSIHEIECTEKCRSIMHGRKICRVALQGRDEEVIALWMKTCVNFGHVKDEFGRTALHMAASVGRVRAVEWLIKREGSLVNLKDSESGYTPLHRSLLYGQISVARLLIKLGADPTIKDNEGLTPLELTSPEKLDAFNIQSEPTEIYVWGRNQNYNLGIENQQNRLYPDVLEKFGVDNDKIEQVVLQQFHSIFKTQLGDVYVCGHGEGGRLGTGNENAVLAPKKLPMESRKVLFASASENHSVFVFDNGSVATCGSNEFAVLGHHPPQDKVLSPKTVNLSRNILQCATSNFHSVFYNKEHVYVCGTNEGQFGHISSQGTKIFKPVRSFTVSRKTGEPSYIQTAVCSDSATAIIERSENMTMVHLLFNHNLFYLKFGNITITKMFLLGGFRSTSDKSSKLCKEADRAEGPVSIVFTNERDIHIWRQDMSKVTRKTSRGQSTVHARAEGTLSKVVFNSVRTGPANSRYAVEDFSVNSNSLIFVTREGTAYTSGWSHKATPQYLDSSLYRCITSSDTQLQHPSGFMQVQNLHKKAGRFEAQDNKTVELLKAKRIPNIYFGENIISDPRGNNFGAIVRNPRCNFYDLPWESDSTLIHDISALLEEANERDNLHDIIFEVEGRRFPAHRFIVASRCPRLYALTELVGADVPIVVKLDSVAATVFEQSLQFLYTSSCDVTASFDGSFEFPYSENGDFLKQMVRFAKSISFQDLLDELRNFEMRGDKVFRKCDIYKPPQKRLIQFQYSQRLDLCDVTIRCLDGEEINAHRCILASRVNYFAAMFSNSWCESTSETSVSIAQSKLAVRVMLEYVYEDKSDTLKVCELDVITEVLVLADHFLLDRLRSLAEIQLADKIHLRNALEILEIADTFNAAQLKNSCFQFLCPHISQLLENRALDQLPKPLANELSEHYRRNYQRGEARLIEKWTGGEESDSDEYESAMDFVSPDIQHLLGDLDKELTQLTIELKKPTPKSSRVRMRARTVSETEAEVRTSPKTEPTVGEGSSVPAKQTSHSAPRVTSESLTRREATKCIVPLPIQKMGVETPEERLDLEQFPTLGALGASAEEKPSCSKSVPGVKKKRKWKSLASAEVEVKAAAPLPAQNPVNPWVKPWEQVPEPGSETDKAFKVIVEEEEEKKSNFEKAVSKPMLLLIIEEAAMTQLTKRYTTVDVMQSVETICVERVCPTSYAEPTWDCQR